MLYFDLIKGFVILSNIYNIFIEHDKSAHRINFIYIFKRYKIANGGVPFDPPKVEVPKKEPSAPVEKGPSKKCKGCSLYLHIIF